MLQPHHIAALESLFARIRSETYPEPPSILHSHLSSKMLDYLFSKHTLPPWARVLDVGCGQGGMIELLTGHSCRTTGITLNSEDVRVCREGTTFSRWINRFSTSQTTNSNCCGAATVSSTV